MKRLIVTADDLGISPAVNEAVVRAYRDGILRFASLMVAEDAAKDAVERVRRECPGLGLGLHLVLCSGRAASAESAGRLAGSDGTFSPDPVACGLRYFFDRSLAGPIERELRAQFERYLAFGLRPGHVDGHLNIHVHPVVFPIAARLAAEYSFGRIRLPGGELSCGLRHSRPRWWPKQLVEGAVFAALRAYLGRAHARPQVAIADRTYGLLRSGLMGERYVLAALESLPEGVSELYFHPSSDPKTAVDDEPAPGHHSVSELRSLVSPAVRRKIESLGIELLGDGGPAVDRAERQA